MSSVFKTQRLVEEPYFVIADNQGHDFAMQWKLAELYILDHFLKKGRCCTSIQGIYKVSYQNKQQLFQ